MSFRPQYGMPYNHYPPQPIVFGQMRMPGQNQPPPKPAQSTPVFVGNISEKCTDAFMEKMLQECGRVVSWKRIKGTNGKLQAFGFCDFADAEGTLRALRILNEFHLGDKKLTVKAEEKIRDDLRRTAIEIRKRQGKRELKLKDKELPVDEDDLKKDEEIRLKILHWIEHDHPELLTVAEDGEISDKDVKKDARDDRRSADRNKKDNRRRSRSRGRSRSPRNKRRRSRSSSSSSDSRSTRSYSHSTDSSRSRSRTPAKKSKRRRDRSGTRSSENEDDARERRIIKQQVKEKEQAYLARLKRWESREKQRSKIYEKEERKEKDRKKDTQKEAKRLKVFLEDYDDEKDDPKYYKSSMLFKRKRDFEREKEADQKDRLREQQEIEELKRQIQAENDGDNNINLEEEAMKRHKLKEDEALKKMRADSGSPNPHQPLGHNQGGEESSSSEGSGSDGEDEEDGEKQPASVPMEEEFNNRSIEIDTPEPPKPPGGWKALGSSEETTLVRPNHKSPNGSAQSAQSAGASQLVQPIAQRLNGVFGNDDEEDEMHRKKKLKPLEITREERMQVMSVDEKKMLTRQIIKNLPTGREELFATPIEWDYIDKNAMETRIKPWVTKKVQEFLGEEEKSLVDFICEKIEGRSSPEQILTDIAMIIDDDADQFVVKMWRLLVYEGRARKIGVS